MINEKYCCPAIFKFKMKADTYIYGTRKFCFNRPYDTIREETVRVQSCKRSIEKIPIKITRSLLRVLSDT